MIGKNRRAAIYARYSSDNQRSESIDAQIRAMTEYCRQKNIVIVETYIDEAKSATTDKRPAFQKMIADSNKKIFDTVIVHKLDRFARNRYDSAFYKRELKKNNITICSVLENLDNSPESIILESVLEGMSEFYSSNLRRETMKGLLENARNCIHTGGKSPLGFDVCEVTRKLIVNDEEAETVKIIFEMYANGKKYGEILEYLHNQGRKTKLGKDFSKSTLNGILTNQKYRGTYIFNKSSSKSADGTRNSHKHKAESEQIIIEGGCPRIVDEETFKKVQDRIKLNQKQAGQNKAKHNYLLSGKIYCKECGRAMVGNARKGGRNGDIYITYRCQQLKSRCRNREINRDYLEKAVINTLEEQIFNEKSLEELTQRIKSQLEIPNNKRDKFSQKLQEVQLGLENVTKAIEGGLLSEVLIDRLKFLEKEKAELETEMAKQISFNNINIEPLEILHQYENLKLNPKSREYKNFIQNYIDKILIGRYDVEIHLNTGFGIFTQLNSVTSMRRQAVYFERGAI